MNENFSILSPEQPNLLWSTAGVFGASDSPIDFTYGGTSDLPSGDQNPEDYAAFPQAMFDEGLVRPGVPVTVLNPATKKKVVVIPRHAKSDENTGMDLAPHSYLELGPSPNRKYVLDLAPVRGYPVAQYPAPEPKSEIQAGAEEVPAESSDLSQVSMEEGGSPGAIQESTESGSSEDRRPDGIKSKNGDGSITYNDGITLFPDGRWEQPVAGGKKTAVWQPGVKTPTYVNNSTDKDDDTDSTIAQAIIEGSQPPDLKGLYRHSAGIRARLKKGGYDLAAANLDWQAAQKHIASLEGPQQLRMRQAVDNAFHSLDVIEELSNKWDGSGYPLLNKARLVLAKQGALGPEAQALATQLEAQIADVTSELGNVYMGGNSPTDHSLKLASRNLSADWSRDTLKAALAMTRKNLVIRDNSIKNAGVSLGEGNRYIKKEGESMTDKKEVAPAQGVTPAPQDAESAARRILAKDPNNEKAKEVLRRLGK